MKESHIHDDSVECSPAEQPDDFFHDMTLPSAVVESPGPTDSAMYAYYNSPSRGTFHLLPRLRGGDCLAQLHIRGRLARG